MNLEDLEDENSDARRRQKRSGARAPRRGRDSGRFSQKETDERRKFFSNLTTIDYPLELQKEECAMLLAFEKARASGDTSHVRSEVYKLLCEQWKYDKEVAEKENPGVPFKVPYPVDLTLTNLARNSMAFKISTGLAALPDPASYKDEHYGPKLKRRPVDALPSLEPADKSMALVLANANNRLSRMTGENAELKKTGLAVWMKLKQNSALSATIDDGSSGKGLMNMLTLAQNVFPNRHTDDLSRDLGIDHVEEKYYRPAEQETRLRQRLEDAADIEAAAAFDVDDVTRTGFENDVEAGQRIIKPQRVPKNILDKQTKKKKKKKKGGPKAASRGDVIKAIGAMRRSNQ